MYLLTIYMSLKKCLFRSSTHLLIDCFLILSHLSCLHILEIHPLSVASFAIIFSHSEGSFILLIVSFIMQKLLSLIRSHLFISAFISITVGGGRGFCCDLCQRVFCLCFPLGSSLFLVLHLDL